VKCKRRDCTGGDVVDGYCDTCGKPPEKQQPNRTEAVGPRSNDARSSAQTAGAPRPTTVATTRGGHGADGLVELPRVTPHADPRDAVLVDPNVPEHHRECMSCNEPVGRSRGGEPGRTEGFCRKCGSPFSFAPKLRPGDLVGGQYEVIGCLAHGGLGWVYLARDHNVEFWVVLKGLIHASDDLIEREKHYLASVDHPNIVKIHNFVKHSGDHYIVMEYVDGTSLRAELEQRREANGGVPDPLPVEEAIAYCLKMLPALGHLHELGLVYCDLKPDNVIHTRNTAKLIDLGGVARLDDPTSQVWGTRGYQAPELADSGPTIASDLFTVGRTLAALCTDFVGNHSTYVASLPPASEVSLYSDFPSLYAFLERATALDPRARFQSAEEMAAQLDGVLREIVSARRGVPTRTTSARFTLQGRGATDTPDWRSLPTPLVDPDDPGTAFIVSIGADDDAAVEQLEAYASPTLETELRLVRAYIATGRQEAAGPRLADLAARHPDDWRVAWYCGVAALAAGDADAARSEFDRAYRWLPGEPAPKLALGLAAELDDDPSVAADWYHIVSRTDDSFTTAAFGLARCREALDDTAGAIEALRSVPDNSSAHLDAGLGIVRLLIRPTADAGHRLPGLQRAAVLTTKLPLDEETRLRLEAHVLEAVLDEIAVRAAPDGDSMFGHPLTDRGVRLGLEHAYRSIANHATTTAERISLVDRANTVRPRTLV